MKLSGGALKLAMRDVDTRNLLKLRVRPKSAYQLPFAAAQVEDRARPAAQEHRLDGLHTQRIEGDFLRGCLIAQRFGRRIDAMRDIVVVIFAFGPGEFLKRVRGQVSPKFQITSRD